MAHHLGRGIIHSHKQFSGKEAQGKAQDLRVFIMPLQSERPGSGTVARSGESASSASTFRDCGSGPAPTSARGCTPRVLMFQSNISFLEFKRCCGEKLGIPCTRVFLAPGGELESISQLKWDDLVV